MDITPTSNIPATRFATMNTEHYSNTRSVAFNVSADFTLSFFSLKQLLFGEYAINGQNISSRPTEADNLFRRLTFYAMEIGGHDTESLPTIHLKRAEVLILRKWLDARMAHCEQERDSESGAEKHSHANSIDEPHKKFNPDTYIAQKFLLLDIREWLLGEIEE